ncbi:MAG: hypothetical protein FWE17_02395, partial [Alphaproteobacteria bacterium]|nr:hypothetical protein [Alphaproteobacteria bacterium]
DAKEPIYKKYFHPVLVNSLIVLALLSLGVVFPRMITTMTIEPIARVTLVYSESMLNKTTQQVDLQVPYTPKEMPEDGFYRPELRDTIISLVKTSTTQFQAMMTMGLLVVDRSFSWSALNGIGAMVKHFVMLIMGLTIVWNFFKLFVKFCLYFVDVIINLSLFAFFFPLGLVFFVLKNSESEGWVKKIGENIAPGMLNKLIGSIVTLATVVITYTVILVLMARFFSGDSEGGAELARAIMSNDPTNDLFSGAIAEDNLAAMTLGGIVVLVFVIRFLAGQIDEVAKMITQSFNIEVQKPEVGEKLGESVLAVGEKTKGFAWEEAKLGLGIGEDKNKT